MVKHAPGPEPHRAIYGFSFNLFFTSLFWLYVIWVLPYQALGYTKYFYFVPDTYFAFSLPVFVLCGMLFFLFLYASVNMAQAANVDSCKSYKDCILVCKCLDDEEPNGEQEENDDKVGNEPVPANYASDIDLAQVSKVLYSSPFNK